MILFIILHQGLYVFWQLHVCSFTVCEKAFHPESGLPDIVPGAFPFYNKNLSGYDSLPHYFGFFFVAVDDYLKPIEGAMGLLSFPLGAVGN